MAKTMSPERAASIAALLAKNGQPVKRGSAGGRASAKARADRAALQADSVRRGAPEHASAAQILAAWSKLEAK